MKKETKTESLLKELKINADTPEFLALGTDVIAAYEELQKAIENKSKTDLVNDLDVKVYELITGSVSEEKEEIKVYDKLSIQDIINECAAYKNLMPSQIKIMISDNKGNYNFMALDLNSTPIEEEGKNKVFGLKDIENENFSKENLKKAFDQEYQKDFKNVKFIVSMPVDKLMVKLFADGQEHIPFGIKLVDDWLK